MSTPFFLFPDGASPTVERIEALTDVQISRNGTERRAALRAYPRYGLSANFVVIGPAALAAFAPMRSGSPVLVPAWMHPFESTDGASPVVDAIHTPGPSRSFLVRSRNGAWRQVSFAVLADRTLAGWDAADVRAWPLVEARSTDDSFDIEHRSMNARLVSLSLMSTSVDEGELPAVPMLDGKPVLSARADWSQAPSEGTAFSSNAWDAGHLTEWELRHAKRTVSVQFTLMSRQAVLEFRAFMRALRGRFQAFRYADPTSGDMKTWRLGNDVVELQYFKPGLARCALQLVELFE